MSEQTPKKTNLQSAGVSLQKLSEHVNEQAEREILHASIDIIEKYSKEFEQ